MDNIIELYARVAYEDAETCRRRALLQEVRSIAAFAALLTGIALTLIAPVAAVWLLME